MKTESKIVVSLVTLITLLVTAGVVQAQSDLGNWQKITAISDAKTHLVPRTSTLDKYPDAPTLASTCRTVVVSITISTVLDLSSVYVQRS